MVRQKVEIGLNKKKDPEHTYFATFMESRNNLLCSLFVLVFAHFYQSIISIISEKSRSFLWKSKYFRKCGPQLISGSTSRCGINNQKTWLRLNNFLWRHTAIDFSSNLSFKIYFPIYSPLIFFPKLFHLNALLLCSPSTFHLKSRKYQKTEFTWN